jgi:DNA-binding transcriptional LysR family regulator
MRIQRTEDLQVFVNTADSGSLSATARRLNSTPAQTSAAVKRLELALGVRLFERTTRQLRLSEAGERFLPHARAALASLAEAELAISGEAATLGHTLRMALPSDLSRGPLLAWLQAYFQTRPNVQLELYPSDRLAQLHSQPIDLAIRYGTPPDSSMIALPLAPDNRRLLVASPGYLEAHGTPQSLAQLRQHNCLCFKLGESVNDRWKFGPEGAVQTVKVTGNRFADDGHLVRMWALDGAGIAYKSQLDIAPDLRSGALVQLLPELITERLPLMLLLVSRNHLDSALRQLAQDMRPFLQQLAWMPS